MLLAGCASGQPAPAPPEQTAQAASEPSSLTVEDVQLEVENPLPARLLVVARGTFPDACTRIDRIDVGDPQPGNVIPVTLVASRPAGAPCEATVTPFEQRFQLPVDDLPAGTYTVDVQGHTATIELIRESASQDGCSAQGADTPLYVSQGLGLCFAFVQDYEIQEPGQQGVLIQGPVVEEEGPEPVSPVLRISVWQDGVDQPIGPYVDGLLAEGEQASGDLERAQEQIGGYPAEVITGLPGPVGSRQAWVNVQGRVLHFLLQPVDGETYPVASAQADDLWNTVIGTLSFFPADQPLTSGPGSSAPRQTHDLPEFGLRLAAPGDWVLFRGEGFAALGRSDGNPNLVTVGLLDDLPTDLEALVDALQARYASQGEPGAEPGPMLLDGEQAVRVTGLQSLCLDVFVPDPAAGVVRQISIHQDACPGGAPTDTVIDILDSIELIKP